MAERAGPLSAARRAVGPGLLLGALLVSGAPLAAGQQAYPVAAGEPLPNIVLILADDLGPGDVGAYNPESRIPTPHIDRIAAAGVRFTDAHAPGTSCIPSRYGLLTGRYPSRLASLSLARGSLLLPGQTTIASLLHDAGYTTAMVGKWHLGFDGGLDCTRALRGGPTDHGFQHFFGMHASLDIPPYFYIRGDRCVAAPTGRIGPGASDGAEWNEIQGAFWRAGAIAPGFHHEHSSSRFREEAVAFLEAHHRERPDRPYFLYLALASPHTPWLPLARFQGVSGAGLYGDFTAQVDDVVGEIAATLERLGYTDNTLLIVTSDNGPVWYPKDVARFGHRATHIYRGMKFDLWEGGHRMPFIARWPGRITPGAVSETPTVFTDLLPTFAALTGSDAALSTRRDGESILPALLGTPAASHAERTLVHFRAVNRLAIRQGPWKLIPGDAEGEGELYHLFDDPSETRNLYRERPEVVRRLAGLLRSYGPDTPGVPTGGNRE